MGKDKEGRHARRPKCLHDALSRILSQPPIVSQRVTPRVSASAPAHCILTGLRQHYVATGTHLQVSLRFAPTKLLATNEA